MRDIIRDLPLGVFLVMLAFGCAFVAVPLYAAWESRQRMKALAAVTPVSIASAESGYTRLEGSAAHAGAATLAPLTGAECVWFRVRVEDSGGSRSRDNVTWRTVLSDESEHPFIVRDDGGAVLVDAMGADITPTDRSLWYGATPEPADRNPPRFPPGENPKGSGLQIGWSGMGSHRYRYTEERIYAGDPIFVQGEFVSAADRTEEEEDDGDEPAAHAPSGATQGSIRRPRERAQPFMISTTSPEGMYNVQQGATAGGLFVSAFFLVLLMLLLWLRYG